MHPDIRAARIRAAMRLILCNLIGVMDFAVVDAACVDVEREAEQSL